MSLVSARQITYIIKGRHSQETDVFGRANKWILRRREGAALEAFATLVAINQDTGLTETGFAGVVEVFVGVGHCVEVVGRFGSFRVW